MEYKKYLIRRHLDIYAELELAKFLERRGIQVFYPFKDIGIDMLAFNGKSFEFYQLRARNEMKRYPNVYWFPIKKRELEKLSKFPNVFFILCALKRNGKFDFFKLPLRIVKKYIKLKEKKRKKEEKMFLEIERIGERNYKIRPERIRKLININSYLFKI
mgnify:CR=1 FL=1